MSYPPAKTKLERSHYHDCIDIYLHTAVYRPEDENMFRCQPDKLAPHWASFCRCTSAPQPSNVHKLSHSKYNPEAGTLTRLQRTNSYTEKTSSSWDTQNTGKYLAKPGACRSALMISTVHHTSIREVKQTDSEKLAPTRSAFL